MLLNLVCWQRQLSFACPSWNIEVIPLDHNANSLLTRLRCDQVSFLMYESLKSHAVLSIEKSSLKSATWNKVQFRDLPCNTCLLNTVSKALERWSRRLGFYPLWRHFLFILFLTQSLPLHSWQPAVQLTAASVHDHNWWLAALKGLNGALTISNSVDFQVETDASSTGGLEPKIIAG